MTRGRLPQLFEVYRNLPKLWLGKRRTVPPPPLSNLVRGGMLMGLALLLVWAGVATVVRRARHVILRPAPGREQLLELGLKVMVEK